MLMSSVSVASLTRRASVLGMDDHALFRTALAPAWAAVAAAKADQVARPWPLRDAGHSRRQIDSQAEQIAGCAACPRPDAAAATAMKPPAPPDITAARRA